MKAKALSSTLAALLALALAIPALAAQPAPATTTVLATATLPDITLSNAQNPALPTAPITNDRGFFLGGVSDLWRAPYDPAGEYWIITDRGPNGLIPPQGGGANRRTFPVPDFDPLILKVRVSGSQAQIIQTVPILTPSGAPVTGLSNIAGKDEAPYNFDASTLLSYNPDGLDAEGLVRAANGDFWVVEEYRPSLVHIGANGRVIRRYIPEGITLNATYPVSATLPAIYDRRTANRGFEGLAITPDNRTLFIALQSPLSNPNRNVGGTSLNTRILAFDPATGRPTAEYVYRFEPQSSFDPSAPFNPTRPNDEMKVSGLIALDSTTLLVLERTDFVAKIYRVTLTGATNILGSQWDNTATSPTLEERTDLAAAGVTPLPKTLIANLEDVNAPDKIEGIALAGPNTIAIANDNDFNITATGIADPSPTRQRSQIITFSTNTLATTLPNSVASGDVAQTSAVLWARASAPGTVTFNYGTAENFAGALTATATVTDTLIPAKVAVSNLTPGTRYYYRATDSAGVSAQGRFNTAAAPTTRRGLRFGVSGDWRGELNPYPAIANAVGRNLDFFLLHGDTIYADYSSPALPLPQATTVEQFRVKHDEVYSAGYGRNFWGELRAATAIFAVIDDHEVTNDFAGGAPCSTDTRFTCPTPDTLIQDSALFDAGMQAFQEYNPIRDEFYGTTGDPRTVGERKLYRNRTFGADAAIFVLDTRSFRDQPLPAVANPADPAQVAAYLAASFNPARTLLGQPQLNDLLNDLLIAERSGVTWKFVMVPEPIQNLGVVAASDRFEGYAAERTVILNFIRNNGIRNVVFIAADIHGTLVNDVTYQLAPGGVQIATGAFEITTGSVAFDAPFGPTVIQLARAAGLLSDAQVTAYNALSRDAKDAFVAGLLNQQITPLGYTPIGLQGSPIQATLVRGGYAALHTFGWTEFAIDPATQELRVTTYGIDSYTRTQLEADPNAIIARAPTVVSEFTVTPQPNVSYLPIISQE
jgi:phosphodiesterase/alkaline phosphatase D-like protein